MPAPAVSNHTVAVTVPELKELIRSAPCESAIMIWGPPGVGKTAAVRQVAGEEGWLCCEEVLSTKPPEDLEGVPFPIDGPDGSKFTYFAPPARFAELVSAEGRPGFLFLDELNTAQPHIQVVAMQIALEKRVGAVKLRPNIRVIAAGNRAGDRAAVTPMPKPLENRFEHYEVVPDADVWSRWALERELDPVLIAFVRAHPSKLHVFHPDHPAPAFPTPRSWEMADRRLKLSGWEHPLLLKMLGGCIGEGIAHEVVAYRRLEARLPQIKHILEDGAGADVPPSSRPDERYFVLTALAAEVLHRPSAERMEQALLYVMRFEVEFGVKFVRDVLTSKGDARGLLIPAFHHHPQLHLLYQKEWAQVLKLVQKAAPVALAV